eukprot:gene4519-13222_t
MALWVTLWALCGAAATVGWHITRSGRRRPATPSAWRGALRAAPSRAPLPLRVTWRFRPAVRRRQEHPTPPPPHYYAWVAALLLLPRPLP